MAPQSRVKHSTTEPLRSLYIRFIKQIKSAILFLSSILEKRNKIWYQDVPYNITSVHTLCFVHLQRSYRHLKFGSGLKDIRVANMAW